MRFWLILGAIASAATLLAALAAGGLLTLVAGLEFAARRGWDILSVASLAKGLSLALIYKAFFALFALPFAFVAVPFAYHAAIRDGADPYARLRFAALCMAAGALGPLAVEAAAGLLGWLGGGFQPRLIISPWLAAFGLFAGPAVAWAIWPSLRKLEQGGSAAPSPSLVRAS